MSAPLGPSSEGWPVPGQQPPTAPAPPPPSPWAPPPGLYDDAGMPSVVRAAAIVTGLASTLTLMFVVFLGAALSDAISDLLDAFFVTQAHAWVTGTFVGLGALCIAADACAFLITRRSRAARVALIALSALTIAVGLILALGIVVSIVHVGAAIAVLVLLTLPDAGRWFARPRT